MKILATLFFTLVFNPAYSADSILLSAQKKELSTSRQWKKLLHIERNWIGIKGSQITDARFFLSGDSNNPEAELEATLFAFQKPAEEFARTIKNTKKEDIVDHSEHPICRFPARLTFLQRNLSEHKSFWDSLPKVNCSFLNIYLNAVDAKSVSFVFSSYYSDSPGSAFGHTFFRINRKSNDSHQELLDFGVGYAAQVSVNNPVLYAVLGLVGGFRGIWTNLPYYYKVREYNDHEARDLWSYDLNLRPEEVEMLSYHLWEVGSTSYTYYFFTQNCAFHMLTVLEAAAPRLNLIDHVPFWYVIPADSMKSLFYEKDLVGNVSFRPSIRRVFNKRLSSLDSKSVDDIKEFAKTFEINADKGSRTDEQYAAYLDTALDLINLKFPNLSKDKNEIMFTQKEKVLSARSTINTISPDVTIEPSLEERPDNSHGSSRFNLGAVGTIKKDFNFGYRFALHDLLDNSVGMPENSQLEFFNLQFKRDDKKVYIDNFNLFKVLNLNPLNFYEKKMSWGLKLGTRRMRLSPATEDFYSTGMEIQAGYAVGLNESERPWTLWSMFRTDLGYAGKEKNDQYGYGALGYQFGLLKRFSYNHALMIQYEKMFPNKLNSFERIEADFRSSLSRDLSIGLGLSKRKLKLEAFLYF